MNNKIEVKVEICREGIQLPEYANEGDSGMDVRAAEDVLIKIGETKIVPTGLKVAIPEGYEIQVRARSGVSAKTLLRVSNGIGTIDESFKNEIGIIVTNTSTLDADQMLIYNKRINTVDYHNEKLTFDLCKKKNLKNVQGDFLIKKGDRIAQLVLQKVPKMKLVQVDDVKKYGKDRMGGYGSTGVK